jgi:hypothetical protein
MVFCFEQERGYRVGSAPDCELRLCHASVLPLHAELLRAGAALRIQALGPVQLDGRDVEAAELAPGSRLQIGAVELRAAWLEPAPAVAATPARPLVAPVATAPDPGFADHLAGELRRAPWFLISAALHAAVLLALLFLVPPPPKPAGERTLLVDLVRPATEPELETPVRPEPTELATEPPPLAIDPPELTLPDPEPPAPSLNKEIALFEDLEPARTGQTGDGLFARIRPGGEEDVLRLRNPKIDHGSFRRTVSELRRSGLEITFVFDSTGSMGGLLQQAKARIAEMIDVLHALVPDAKVGIVTYRDRGNEEYLTRELPLDEDHFRAMNFLQFVEAGGGGDHPEAVDAGLEQAFRMRWTSQARRVVLLIGDAPPHDQHERRLLQRVRSFSKDGRGFVHTILTGSRNARETPAARAFTAIAKAGLGHAQSLGDDREILREVLALSIGPEFAANLDEVWKVVRERRAELPTKIRELASCGQREPIATALRDRHQREAVAAAILRDGTRAGALALVDVLHGAESDPPSRQAAAATLQRLLGLPRPPIDPEAGRATSRGELLREIDGRYPGR